MSRTTMDPILREAVRLELEQLPSTTRHGAPSASRMSRSALRARATSTRPHVLGLLGACVAATGIAVVLVAVPPSTTTANADEILQRAATHASTSTAGSAGTVITFVKRTLEQIDTDGRPGIDVAVTSRGVTMLKIPEGDDPWIRKSWTTARRVAYGDETLLPKDGATSTEQHPSFQSSVSGAFVNDPPPPTSAPLGYYPDSIRDLPRDPEALLAALRRAHDPSEPASAYQVLEAASTVLSSGIADGELQAAVFAALQLTPDLAVLDQHATDLDGRTGVAIGLRPGTFDASRTSDTTELLIDPTTGQFLGERTTALHVDGAVPAGAELYQIAVTTDTTNRPDDWRLPAPDRMLTYP